MSFPFLNRHGSKIFFEKIEILVTNGTLEAALRFHARRHITVEVRSVKLKREM